MKKLLLICFSFLILSMMVFGNTTIDNTTSIEEKENLNKELTIFMVISAALVDAINPCAFAVLILLLSGIMKKKNKGKTLLAGLLFATAIFISYFLMGIGLFHTFATSGMTSAFYMGVSILAIIIGLLNIKDYFWYGKFVLMEVPQSWRPHMNKILTHVTSPIGAFFAGIVVSLFLLPCTSGPYITILGYLSNAATKSYATAMMFLYNLVFVSPMIIITILVTTGVAKTKKLEKLRSRNLGKLHLVAGLILVAMGLFMLLKHLMII